MCFQGLLVGCDAPRPESMSLALKAPLSGFCLRAVRRKPSPIPGFRDPNPQFPLYVYYCSLEMQLYQGRAALPFLGRASGAGSGSKLGFSPAWLALPPPPPLSGCAVGPSSWTGPWLFPRLQVESAPGEASAPRGLQSLPGCVPASVLRGALCTRPLGWGDCGTQTEQEAPEAWAPRCPCISASLCLCALQTTQAGWWWRSPCT